MVAKRSVTCSSLAVGPVRQHQKLGTCRMKKVIFLYKHTHADGDIRQRLH